MITATIAGASISRAELVNRVRLSQGLPSTDLQLQPPSFRDYLDRFSGATIGELKASTDQAAARAEKLDGDASKMLLAGVALCVASHFVAAPLVSAAVGLAGGIAALSAPRNYRSSKDQEEIAEQVGQRLTDWGAYLAAEPARHSSPTAKDPSIFPATIPGDGGQWIRIA